MVVILNRPREKMNQLPENLEEKSGDVLTIDADATVYEAVDRGRWSESSRSATSSSSSRSSRGSRSST
jgi:hypothetical protein